LVNLVYTLTMPILSIHDIGNLHRGFPTFSYSAVSLNGKFLLQLSEHLLVSPCLDKRLPTIILCCTNMLQLHGSYHYS